LLVATACATAPIPRVSTPPLVHAGAAPEIDALLEAFYGDGLAPEEALARAEGLLRQHPDSSRAHEVAAWASLLLGDADATWRHFAAAAADLDADATALYLSELGTEPRSQGDASARLFEQLRLSHPRADVRALAAARLASYDDRIARFPEEEALIASVGMIYDWAVVGSFDNDQGKGFFTVYPPEERVDLNAEVPGPLVPLRWRRANPTRLGNVALDRVLGARDFGVAYLATWVKSDRERTAQLRLSSSSPTRAFFNDALVLSEEQVAAADFDNLVAPVALQPGWNKILVKSAHRKGMWAVRARLTCEDGAPCAGLTFSSRAQPTPRGQARKPADALRPGPAPGGPEARQRFLESRLLARDGRSRPTLAALQQLLAAHPDNLLVTYFAALAYWDNEELGKAIDLLDRGVKATGGKAGAFLTKRGRYFAQKKLWDRAQADLEAAAALGGSRGARVELADYFQKRGWQTDRCRLLADTLARWPDWAWALRQRSDCLEAQDYLDESERCLTLAVALEPSEQASWVELLKAARRRGDLDAGERAVQKLRELFPSDPGFVLEQGELARRRGKLEEARGFYEQAARMGPEFARPHERLGSLAWEQGDKAKAVAAWRLALQRDPNNAVLAQRMESLEPVKLGALERYVPGDAEIDRALAARPQAFPGSQMALLLDHEVTEVNADGSARRVVTDVKLALDDKGRDAMTLERLPTAGTLKILRAWSVGADGERQEASSIRGGEVRFRTLQVGSRTVVQYVHYSPPPRFVPRAFASSWYFQSVSRQHEDATWVLLLERGRTLHEAVVGPVTRERREEGGRDVVIFRATHTAPLVHEPNMPPAQDLLAHVEVSTVEGWDDYVRFERALLADAFRTNPALDALVDQLLAGAATPRERLDRLFHHVAEEVRYQQDYETTIAGVRPHAAPVVLERGYGDCKDKAVLLVQMARRAGLALHFAILRTTPEGRVHRDIPNQQFNHAIAYVPAQEGIEEPFFMDPTADGLDMGNLRPDDQGALALVMDPFGERWEFREIPYQDPTLQFVRHRVRVEVASDSKATAVDEMAVRGGKAMNLRHTLRNEGEARKIYESIATSLFPSSTPGKASCRDKDDTWHPIEVSLESDVSQSLRPEGDGLRLVMPGSFPLYGVAALSQRETPLDLGAPDSTQLDLEATLPEGFQVERPPKDLAVEHACFSYHRKVKSEARKVVVRTEYLRRCPGVAVADYQAFRAAVLQVMRLQNNDVYFTATPVKAPAKKAR
jgi:tetratricopeptide (TPR) repeat protein/transglutaminase-like putative cysteine protease